MPSLPINLRRVAVLAGVVILVFLVIDFNTRLSNLVRLQDQAVVVRADATHVMQTQEALYTAIAYATSDEAVDEYARREMHYIKEGDQPVVPMAQGGAPETAPTPLPPAPTPAPNWQLWMDLFFGP